MGSGSIFCVRSSSLIKVPEKVSGTNHHPAGQKGKGEVLVAWSVKEKEGVEVGLSKLCFQGGNGGGGRCRLQGAHQLPQGSSEPPHWGRGFRRPPLSVAAFSPRKTESFYRFIFQEENSGVLTGCPRPRLSLSLL